MFHKIFTRFVCGKITSRKSTSLVDCEGSVSLNRWIIGLLMISYCWDCEFWADDFEYYLARIIVGLVLELFYCGLECLSWLMWRESKVQFSYKCLLFFTFKNDWFCEATNLWVFFVVNNNFNSKKRWTVKACNRRALANFTKFSAKSIAKWLENMNAWISQPRDMKKKHNRHFNNWPVLAYKCNLSDTSNGERDYLLQKFEKKIWIK